MGEGVLPRAWRDDLGQPARRGGSEGWKRPGPQILAEAGLVWIHIDQL